MSQMRCDSCEALRWYGRELHRVTVTEYPGPVTRVYFICEMCQEQRAAALWPEDWEPREPQMHPPHLSRQ